MAVDTIRKALIDRTNDLALMIPARPPNAALMSVSTRTTHEFANAATEGLHSVHYSRPQSHILKAIDVILLDLVSHYVELEIHRDVDISHSHISQ